MKRLLVVVSAAMCAVAASAMPTKEELAKAQPLVAELMAPELAKFKAAGNKEKAAAAAKVGDASSEFAKAAETEAAKFLLLKGAVSFYARGEAYDQAADTVAALQCAVKDVPPSVIAEITGKATGKISEAKAPKLYAIYRSAKLQVKAADEAKALAAKLKKGKSDALQRKYAEALAVSGDWKAAYAEFAKVNDEKLKAIVSTEAAGNAKNAESGEFWWSYESVFKDGEDFFKSHAADYYGKALEAGEITGLMKNLAERRVASRSKASGESSVKVAKRRDPLKHEGFLPKKETLLWKNVSLSEIVKIEGYTGGKACYRNHVVSSHMKEVGDTKTFQFQCADDAFIKCVGIELRQRGADICGRVVYGRYVRHGFVGDVDFDIGPYETYYVADQDDRDGYGLRDFCVVFGGNVKATGTEDGMAAKNPGSEKPQGKKVSLQDKRVVLSLPDGGDITLIRCPAGKYMMGFDLKPTGYFKPKFGYAKTSLAELVS